MDSIISLFIDTNLRNIFLSEEPFVPGAIPDNEPGGDDCHINADHRRREFEESVNREVVKRMEASAGYKAAGVLCNFADTP